MQAVAIQGPLPGYQLKNADLTCSSLGELTVYNLRSVSQVSLTEVTGLAPSIGVCSLCDFLLVPSFVLFDCFPQWVASSKSGCEARLLPPLTLGVPPWQLLLLLLVFRAHPHGRLAHSPLKCCAPGIHPPAARSSCTSARDDSHSGVLRLVPAAGC